MGVCPSKLARSDPFRLSGTGPNRVPEMQRALQNDTRFIHQKMPRAKLYMRAFATTQRIQPVEAENICFSVLVQAHTSPSSAWDWQELSMV